MNRRHFILARGRIICVSLACLMLCVGCIEAPHTVSQVTVPPQVSSKPELPVWLQEGPKDWDEVVWQEYQAWLIRFRAPITRQWDYSDEELVPCKAEVEHSVGEYEDHIRDEWLQKWEDHLLSYERTGGCGCCNEVYTVVGPRAAIEEFPVHPGRTDYYPKYIR